MSAPRRHAAAIAGLRPIGSLLDPTMLPTALPLGPGDLRGTLLLRDRLGAEAAFLLVQLVKAALQGDAPAAAAAAQPAAAAAAARRVVLLAAVQAASHYAAVLRKAGLQCPALVEAGRLAVVEALPAGAGLPSLRDLHRRLADAAASGSSDSGSGGGSGGVVLVADDLTVHRLQPRLLPVLARCGVAACTSRSRGSPIARAPASLPTPRARRPLPCRRCAAWQPGRPTGRRSCRPAQRWARCALACRCCCCWRRPRAWPRCGAAAVRCPRSSLVHQPPPAAGAQNACSPPAPLPAGPRRLLCGAGA